MLQSGMKITIIKEPDNSYDPFAIRVELDDIGCVGHIANRSRTRFIIAVTCAQNLKAV